MSLTAAIGRLRKLLSHSQTPVVEGVNEVHLHPNKHLISVQSNRGRTEEGKQCIIPAGVYAISWILYDGKCPNREHITVILIYPPEGGSKYLLEGNIPYTIHSKYRGEKI